MSQYSGLKVKAIRGALWSSIQKFAVTFLTFVSEIVLARLLLPYDFGCVEILAIFVLLADTLVSGGFGTALVQKKNPTKEDYSTVFYWNMVVAVVLYIILFFCAPAISRFYNIPALSSILRIQSIVLFINAFNLVQQSQLQKQLRFKEIATASVIASAISLSVTIVMALLGYGVWSLVAKNIVLATFFTIISSIYTKWKPSFVFSWASFKELFSFGFYMLLSNIVTSISSKIQSLLIGKFFNPTTMGFYAKASGTEGIASTTFSQIMDQVTYPLYAQLQDDKVALRTTLKCLINSMAYITFPILCICILVAKPLFGILYSEAWLPSAPYFQVLCIGGFAACLQSVNFHTISAIGKSKITLKWTIVKRILGIALIVGGLILWGMKGLLCGVVLNAWLAFIVNVGLVSKYIGYKWYQQFVDLAPISIVCCVCFICSFAVSLLLHNNMYVDGIIKTVTFLGMFSAWIFIAKPKEYDFIKKTIVSFIHKSS